MPLIFPEHFALRCLAWVAEVRGVAGGGSAQPTGVAVRCRLFASPLERLLRFAGSPSPSAPDRSAHARRNHTVAKACRKGVECCFPSPSHLPDLLPPYTGACRCLAKFKQRRGVCAAWASFILEIVIARGWRWLANAVHVAVLANTGHGR